MKRSIALLALTFGISFPFAGAAQLDAQPEIQLLDQLDLDKTDFSRALFSELGRFMKFDSMPMAEGIPRMMARANWLATKVRKPDADYRFGYALAVYEWKLGNEKNAAVYLALADLRAFADSQRCEDQSSPASRLTAWRKASGPIYVIIKNGPIALKTEVRNVIESEEANLHLRTASLWMCNGGTKQIAKILQKYPEIGSLDASKTIPKEILEKYPSVITVNGKNIELTDYSIAPDLRSDEEWKRDLPKIVKGFKKNYFSAFGISDK